MKIFISSLPCLRERTFLSYLSLILLFNSFTLFGQTITKQTGSTIPNTVCPNTSTVYRVSLPSNFSTCRIEWLVTNGIVNGPSDQQEVTVNWFDIPGAISKITVRFHGCPNGNPNEGGGSTKEELILSVNNQGWGSFTNSVDIDFCTTTFVDLFIPRMFVIGTGGAGQPPLQEVRYVWDLPVGWRTETGATGQINTTLNVLRIFPTNCALPGNVAIKGLISDRCGAAGLSKPTSISLNGINPVVVAGSPPGFTGVTACDTTPVTFTATLSPSLGCVSNYSWSFPSGWTVDSQNANTITLKPNGTRAIEGDIKATVNFACGSSRTSGAINPAYIPPQVLGPNFICTSGTFSIMNAPFAIPTWSSSNTTILTIVPSTGVATRLQSRRGSVTVTATFNCPADPATKTVWVGQPLLTSENLYVFGAYGQNPVTLNSGAYYYFDIVKLISTNPTIYQRVEVPGATQYTWYVPSGFSLFANYGNRAIIQTASANGTYTPYVAAENICGSGGARALTVVVGSGGGGGIILITTPNPVTDELDVRTENDLSETIGTPGLEGLPVQNSKAPVGELAYITLYDELGREVLTHVSGTLKAKLYVGHLKEGLYILKARQGDKVYVQRIFGKR